MSRRWLLLHAPDDGIREFGGANRHGVVRAGLHVVGDVPSLRDHRRERPLQEIRGFALSEVPEHQHPGEDGGGWVHLGLTGILRGTAVGGLEYGHVTFTEIA